MKKIFNWVKSNFLFLEILFLMIFIPLWPKIPLINVQHTWVYIRIEDFLVLFVLFSWAFLLLRKKINIRTPLTLPILIFWLIGAIATMHGILLIFPTLANVFANVAFFSLLRHIEYVSLFFIAYQGMKDKKLTSWVFPTILLTLIAVIAYGFGQKYLGFPAFLTSNEEFAKGIPIQLSDLSRIPSTFAGHYDLAAYLVLIVPIVVSMIFGYKNLFVKFFLAVTAILGFILLFMTVSRVSFFAIIISIILVFFFHKRKFALLIPPVLIIFAIVLIVAKPTILNRFQSTVSEIDVLVDAKTGASVGHVNFVPASYFKDKVVLQRRVQNQDELVNALAGEVSPSSSPAAIIYPFKFIPPQAPLVQAVNVSTGESLPQGTGYINLSLSPVVRKLGDFFYELPPNVKSSPSAQFLVLHGNFIVKKAAAYDLSFTTRFQGEWPRAIEAFQKNILIGSGYGSVSLAVDNNFLRILGETGALGFLSFFGLFLIFGIYIKNVLPDLDSKLTRSFVIGVACGIIGLAFNATLIDVFEASKIAFLLWILIGLTLGILTLNQKSQFNLLEELKKMAVSTYAVAVYLLSFSVLIFSQMIDNFFVGDDFTWLRWAAQAPSNLLNYFTQSDGFFYRPGAKIYFYLMYHFFWLNQVAYHVVSLTLHFGVALLFFVLAKKIFKNVALSFICAFLFLIGSGFSETVFWISSTGILFNAFFGLLGLLFYINFDEKKKSYYLILSLISFSLALLFHELGVVLPLLVIAYKLKDNLSISTVKKLVKRVDYLLLFVPVIFYLILRLASNSHWLSGDYNYSLIKLPFNFIGNIFGYIMLTAFGIMSLPVYELVRNALRTNIVFSVVLVALAIAVIVFAYREVLKRLEGDEKAIIVSAFSFFLVSLLPFLGLGNITSRYSYLSAIGVIIILVLVFKKLYKALIDNGRKIALSIAALIILVYSLFQLIQVQQAFFDWSGAGVKSQNFFISLDSLYDDSWSKGPFEFHFVNVPIRSGEAWVFPVGLNDAVWFAFKNNDAKIYIDSDANSAFQQIGNASNKKAFQFNDDGTVSEIFPTGKPN